MGASKPPAQLGLAFPKPTFKWGGARPGAGRKPTGKSYVRHVPRPFHERWAPVHITYRVRDDVPLLRRASIAAAVVDAIAAAHKPVFRVCHYSIQADHIHCIVEAGSKRSLTRGVQGLAIRMARAVNRAARRKGKVFVERYHAHELRTPKETKHALAYVLLNQAKHLRPARGAFVVDEHTSGAWFDGWKWAPFVTPKRDRPVAPPTTWLLRAGWRKHGWVDPEKTPGAG